MKSSMKGAVSLFFTAPPPEAFPTTEFPIPDRYRLLKAFCPQGGLFTGINAVRGEVAAVVLGERGDHARRHGRVAVFVAPELARRDADAVGHFTPGVGALLARRPQHRAEARGSEVIEEEGDDGRGSIFDKGLKFLISRQDKKTGYFGVSMYAHGLATIAVCEAYGLTQDPALRRPAQNAINLGHHGT